MLILKRVTDPYEFVKCKISGELITYGDYYYHDDVDNLIVKASVYGELLKKKKEEDYDYTKLNTANSLMDYSERLKQIEKDYLKNTLFERPKLHNGGIKYDGE